ncbi:hypothetical protein B0H11DRAFT_2017887 [Mycena galericulata]|nr:hypothetical protein B0H11DRAFT_2017887 [Mycena galericulata]
MFSKLFLFACIFTLCIAAPLPVTSHDVEVSSRASSGGNEGPLTDADGYRCTQQYTVRPGDTCTSVSIAFGLTPATLIHMNPEIGEDCTSLNVGQEYCVQTVISGNTGRSFVLNGFR